MKMLQSSFLKSEEQKNLLKEEMSFHKPALPFMMNPYPNHPTIN
jgi:hypothetical protein